MLVEPTKTGALNDAPTGVLSLASKLVVKGEERLSADFFAILNMVASQWHTTDTNQTNQTQECPCCVHHLHANSASKTGEPSAPTALKLQEQAQETARQIIPTQIYLGFLTGRTTANSQFAA